MRPFSAFSTMCRPSACAMRKPAFRFTSSISRHCASLTLEGLLRFLAPRARGVHEKRDAAEAPDRLLGKPLRLAGPGEVGVGEVGAEHLRALRRERGGDARGRCRRRRR